jgi:ABC-2 type transport system ATP-binding protein
MDAIVVKNLTKRFGSFTAVDSISFEVKEGELFGLLGPNGAGKTTTINMLSTLMHTTSGEAVVAGHNVKTETDGVRQSIGIVFQEPALDGKLTGKENLEFHSMMYGLSNEQMKKKVAEVLALVDLTDKADNVVEKYSGGMKRRLEIARGLIQEPKVLFLDEPTLGLDAQTRRHIWDYIKKLNHEKKVSIILTTHYMEEADYLCDRVAIIDRGKIVALDTPEKLKDSLGGDVVCIDIEGDGDVAKRLSGLKYVKNSKELEKGLCLTMEHGETRIPELVTLAQKDGAKVISVSLHKPSLEDVFLKFTGKSIREEEPEGRGRMMRRMHG